MGVLSKLTISASGAVGPSKGHDQIKKWAENNGGKWVAKPLKSSGLTHLICSRENWKARVDIVQTALQQGTYVVSYDWLEDSLQSRRKLAEKKYTWMAISKERKVRKKFKRLGGKFDTIKFQKGCDQACEELGSGTSTSSPALGKSRGSFFASSLEALRKKREAREAREAAEATTKALEANYEAGDTNVAVKISDQPESGSISASPSAIPKFERVSRTRTPSIASASFITPPTLLAAAKPQPVTAKSGSQTEKLTDNYHIYIDSTGFEYSLKLLRTNVFQNSLAQYQLRLYESNTIPHTYCTFIRYSPPGGKGWLSASIPVGEMGAHSQPQSQIPARFTNGIGGGCDKVHPHLVHALSLMQPSSPAIPPSANQPYRALLSPLNSDYNSAFLTFRAAFQELTFLAWEERLVFPSCNLQKHRAQDRGLEPFVWKKPNVGLPVGAMSALPGLEIGLTVEVKKADRGEGGLGLPAMDVKLAHDSGILGSTIHREAMVVSKAADAAQQAALGNKNDKQKKKQPTLMLKTLKNKDAPLFNGSTIHGWTSIKNEKGGSFGILDGGVKKRWPKECSS